MQTPLSQQQHTVKWQEQQLFALKCLEISQAMPNDVPNEGKAKEYMMARHLFATEYMMVRHLFATEYMMVRHLFAKKRQQAMVCLRLGASLSSYLRHWQRVPGRQTASMHPVLAQQL
jgi:hypothetical protein